jgi:hypothetical protein
MNETFMNMVGMRSTVVLGWQTNHLRREQFSLRSKKSIPYLAQQLVHRLRDKKESSACA